MLVDFVNYLVVFSFVFLKVSDSARILIIFPAPLISHQSVLRPLVEELVKRHEVLLITSKQYHNIPTYQEEHVSENLTNIILNFEENKIYQNSNYTSTIGIRNKVFTEDVKTLEEHGDLFEMFLQTDLRTKKLFEPNNHFDLMILDANIQLLLSFTHFIKAPAILLSSNGGTNLLYHMIGASMHPTLHHTKYDPNINMASTWDRLMRIYQYFRWMYEWQRLENKNNEIIRRNLGAGVPNLSYLADNVHLLFLNMHPVWDGFRPTPPALIYVWGIHLQPEKILPKEIQRYIEASKHGVIYMSLGTNVKSCMIPQKWVDIFLRVFSQLSYNILLKWDEDELPGKPENVRIEKYFPQPDLLRHPNVKLFVTQGGVQSTDEAIQAGVPLLGIPLISDQWFQTAKYEHFEIGIQLDPKTLTENSFRSAIEAVISNRSYKLNMMNLRNQMLDQPGLPGVSRALWWIEYVLRHKGASHLRAQAANMPLVQYLEMKLVFFVFMVVFTFVFVFVLTLRLFVKYLRKWLWRKQKLH